MAVTAQRLIVKRGWFSRRTFEMQIGKIEHVEIDQGAFRRFLNYGTLRVGEAAGSPEPFKVVWNPTAFRQAVQGQLGVPQAARLA